MVFGGVIYMISRNASSKGALQVTATPKSKVYLDGKMIGETPLCKCEYPNILPTGTYTIKIVPEGTMQDSFEQKITIEKSVVTVVDRIFAGPMVSDGSIISLKELPNDKDIELFVSSFPDKANVLLDRNLVGQTPLLLKNITSSDHEVTMEKGGYKEKTVHIHTVQGYKLTTIGYLAVDPSSLTNNPVASSSATTIPPISPSLSVSPSPLVSEKVSSSPSPKASITMTPAPGTVTILDTPTGYLNVHTDASISSQNVGKAKPGENYKILDEKNSMYQIKLSDGTLGWITNQYAKKN